jgi:hypothetical protein
VGFRPMRWASTVQASVPTPHLLRGWGRLGVGVPTPHL